MRKPVKRPYRSAIRREQSEATRARILEAAGALFETNGFARTTMNEIAERAGVVVGTVYSTFGSKGRVLTSLIDRRATESQPMHSILEHPDAIAIRVESDQRRQVALWVRFLAGAMGRTRALYEIMRSAADVDDEMSSIFLEMQNYRLINARTVAGWIADNGKLRVPVERAAQIFWTIASPEVAKLLLDVQGWSEKQWTAWLEETLTQSLLRD